jgi:hypothetical protein
MAPGPIANGQLGTGPLSRQRDSNGVNSYSTSLASVTTAQHAMAGGNGLGTLVHKDHFYETYV